MAQSMVKGSPLKSFLERKKKPKEFHIEIAKSETVYCPDCGQKLFNGLTYSGCICMGENANSKIWVKKSEDGLGVNISFSRGWSFENIEMLLDTLRRKNGKN